MQMWHVCLCVCVCWMCLIKGKITHRVMHFQIFQTSEAESVETRQKFWIPARVRLQTHATSGRDVIRCTDHRHCRSRRLCVEESDNENCSQQLHDGLFSKLHRRSWSRHINTIQTWTLVGAGRGFNVLRTCLNYWHNWSWRLFSIISN